MERARASVVLAAGLALLIGPSVARADDAWLGPDKRLHFGASAVIAASGYGLAATATQSRGERALAGASLSLLVGAATEGWDATGRGDPSWRDLAWDAVGAAVGVTIAWAIDLTLGSRGRARAGRPLVLGW